ncbi:MAG: response regulator transcription factor [Anaerolineaceae bacterium]|nr:response regulator transcription factor [Anaerolineaceae bacterium]
MTQTTTRVVLAEDNDIVRRGIRKLLNKAQDIEVVGEAKNGIEALRLVEETQPDILLLDVEMPLLNGIEVAKQLKKGEIKTRILVLSAYDDRQYIQEMLSNGASGYLLKDEASERIVDAVQGVAQGKAGWLSPQVEAKLRRNKTGKIL